MQLILVGIVGYGLLYGEPKAIINGTISLLITFSPALLERNYRVPLDPWLGLWITLAVSLHTVGSAGLYTQIGWWDHLTHGMSASLVAGVGYTFARGVDLHSDQIHLPQRFFFVYVLVVVLSFGVLWELFEYGLDIAADATGLSMPLAQHGLDDTVRDLMFNSLGALLVATFGQAHLSGIAELVLEGRIENRSEDG
jgi:uncharacterized membrane protein YjdF